MSHKKLSFIIILSIALITCSYFVVANYGYFSGGTNAPSVPEDTMTRGLVGYWSMDEGSGQTAYDASGNGNNGTLGASSAAGSDDPTWTANGKNAGGMSFDGVDDYVIVADDNSLDITDAITIEAWIYPKDITNYQYLFSKSNSVIGEKIFIYNNNLYWYDSYINGDYDRAFAGGTFDSTEKWYHIVLNWQSDGTMNIFVNGDSYSITNISGDWIGTAGTSANAFYISKYSNNYFNGSIDEVRIYNRALTADEVRYHYNRGGPVGYWNFDEGSGTVAYDSSINRNNGTLTNFGSTDTGTAESGGDSTLTDSDKAWTTDQWADGSINITGGTGSGQTRTISSNTSTIITVSSNWTTNPDATSTYSLTQAPTWTSGKYGSAIQFDGKDDYVDAGNDSSLDITDAITIEAWVKKNVDNLDDGGIIKKYDAIDGQRAYTLETNFNSVRFILSPDGTSSTIVNTTDIEPLLWNHIVGVSDGSSYIKLYINGILKDSDSYSGGINIYTGTNLLIGRDISGQFLDGSIDDVRIYDYARTADEIRLDYNAGVATHLGPSGKTCSEDPASCMDYGLVGSWGMDEGSGQTAYDASDNGNDGTLGASASSASDDPRWTEGACLAGASCGGGLKFDGVDDYVDCGNDSSLDITDAITLSAWTYINFSSNYEGIIGRQYASNYGIIKSSTNWVSFYVNSNYPGPYYITEGWHYLVGTYDGNTINFYVDGNLEKTSNFSGSINTANSVNIGRYYSGGWRYFNGSIDEVRIYNRALSAEEIRYHYNKGEPVAHWKFDEGSGTTAYDESFNNNDGTLTNMDNSDWVQGKFGTALDFDGSDDYVNCGNDASLNLGNNMTISFWANFSSSSQGEFIDLHSNEFGTMQMDFYLNKIRIFVTGSVVVESSFTPVFGDWYYITYTRNGIGSGNSKIYINGNSQTLLTDIGNNFSDTSSNLLIGKRANVGNYFNGLIDDVRIYNYARTADEIRLDYNAGVATHLGPSGKTCSEDPASCMDYGLVGSWGMDEGSGTTAYDASDNSNNGTLTNGPVWSTDSPPWQGGAGGGSLQFDGVDDYISLGNVASLNPSPNMSILAWIKPLSRGSGGYGRVIHKDLSYQIMINNDDDAIKFLVYNSAGGYNNPIIQNCYIMNEWNFVALTTDATTFTTYCNMNSYSEAKTGTGIKQNSNNISIGSYGDIDLFFDGSIDDVRVYNRALSAEEVRYHYNKGGPVAEWNFDEGSGTTAYDESFNNNDGTLINMDNSDWVQGKFGTALDFDGSNDYVKIADDDSLDFGTGDFSYSLWVNTTQDCGGNKVYIGQRENSRPSVWLGCNGTDDTAVFSVEDSNNDGGLGLTTKAINDGKWHHLVGVKEGHSNATITVYIDGIRYTPSSVTFTGHFNYGVAYEYPTNIGNFLGSYYVDAIIDDVRIYNYARTADEILVDYNAGVATHF